MFWVFSVIVGAVESEKNLIQDIFGGKGQICQIGLWQMGLVSLVFISKGKV
jgi:hypothetical protein